MENQNLNRRLETTWRKTSSIQLNPLNPRDNDDVVPVIELSIKKFGFIQPICIDKDGMVVCGNTRLKAAINLGLEEVPCVSVEHLSALEVKELIAYENKMHELARHNYQLLKEHYLDPILAEVGRDDPFLNQVWSPHELDVILQAEWTPPPLEDEEEESEEAKPFVITLNPEQKRVVDEAITIYKEQGGEKRETDGHYVASICNKWIRSQL